MLRSSPSPGVVWVSAVGHVQGMRGPVWYVQALPMAPLASFSLSPLLCVWSSASVVVEAS